MKYTYLLLHHDLFIKNEKDEQYENFILDYQQQQHLDTKTISKNIKYKLTHTKLY
jgi:hypothetical protein